jgi:hypothetical protein
MVLDKIELIATVNQFFHIELESSNFHRFGRDKSFFTDWKLEDLRRKTMDFYNQEKTANEWNVFKKSYGHFFETPFYLKRAIHILKRMLKFCDYEMDFYGFPVRKMVIISNVSVENPIRIPRKLRKDKPKGVVFEHKEVVVSFGSTGICKNEIDG